MEMAGAMVGPLLSKFQEVAVKEAKALAAVSGEIDKLRDKLMWLQALLHETDLCSRHDGNRLVWVLACQIREVAFEAEDAVDKFYLEADLSRRNWRRAAVELVANFRKQLSVRSVLSRKIQSMNARLEEIVDNSAKYSAGQGRSGEEKSWRASRAIPPMRQDWDKEYLAPLELKCRKKKKEELEVKLKKSGPAVIHIVGVGGVGKRALLRYASEDASIKNHFNVRICMSFPPGISDSSMVDQIMEKLKDKDLQQVRFLVVIDSPVNTTTWSIVEPKLGQMARAGSKILLSDSETSRHEEKNDNIIQLRQFSAKDSITLFNHVYGLNGKRTSDYQVEEMDKIRLKIMKLTNGLPIAVVLLAKLMRTMDLSKWEAASVYIMSNNEDSKLRTILSVCIDDLPDELKSCLLFTAGFPDNRVIDAHQLVRLWMAEGFLVQQHEVETEQLGQCYLKELIYRGLLQLIDKTGAHGGLVKSVAIHDQIHRLLRSEAQRTSFMDVHYGGCIPAPENTRRLALHNYNDKFPALSNCLDKLRTVVSHSAGYPKGLELEDESSRNEPTLNMREHLLGSPYLRVINLEGLDIGRVLPDEIGEMVHLQYLGVRCQRLEKVPSSIGNLGKLQTIDVRGTQVRKLPRSLWKIRTLRHVLGNGLDFPISTGDLKLMQTLESVTIHFWRTATSKRGKKFGLRFLQRLHVVGLNQYQRQSLETILKDLSSLESLTLSGAAIPFDLFTGASTAAASCLEHVASLELDGQLLLPHDASDNNLSFSGLNRCMLNITRLVLRSTNIAQKFIHVIAKLPVLAELELHIRSYVEEELVICTHGFSSLTVLRISGLDTLKRIYVPAAVTAMTRAIEPTLIDILDQVEVVKTKKCCRFCQNSQENGGEEPGEATTHEGIHDANDEAAKQSPLPPYPEDMAPCQVCMNDHLPASTGSRFTVNLIDGHFENSMTVPCNVRLQFNEITGGTVQFQAHEQTYNIEVQKARTKTRLVGAEWNRFITQNHLVGGEMLCFSLGGSVPTISVVFLNTIGEEDEEEESDDEKGEEGEPSEEEEAEDDESEEEDPLEHTIISRRCNLTDSEKEHLLQLLPLRKKIRVGKSYVTRLNKTNIDSHDMKLPMSVRSTYLGLSQGLVGVRVADGELSTIEYKAEKDGRLSFNKKAWKNFIQSEEDLQIGQAMLMTARETPPGNQLKVIFVIDIINA